MRTCMAPEMAAVAKHRPRFWLAPINTSHIGTVRAARHIADKRWVRPTPYASAITPPTGVNIVEQMELTTPCEISTAGEEGKFSRFLAQIYVTLLEVRVLIRNRET